MPNASAKQDRAFYDVFISYRHRDKKEIDALEQKIRDAGFEPFRDLNFPKLQDTTDVTRAKIEIIRGQLSRATCLLFAYSRQSAGDETQAGESVGAWMPWELGFFDGAVSSRIGVYLLDGPRGNEDPRVYFNGSEYLQLYEELTEGNLVAFLKRNAVRERRIDNVAGAFVWFEHLTHECVANPTNVNLGMAEWFADHAAAFWAAQGAIRLAEAFGRLKTVLDDIRVTSVPKLRLPFFDDLRPFSAPPRIPESTQEAAETQRPAEAPFGMTYAPRTPQAGPGADQDPLPRMPPFAWPVFRTPGKKR